MQGIRIGDGALSKGVDPVTGQNLFTSVPYQIVGVATGNGGAGARGGDIINVTLNGDGSGFFAIAGNGGDGRSGGRGGSITNLVDLGSYNSQVDLIAGNGGAGFSGVGGDGGKITLGQFSTTGDVRIILGDGGDGAAAGGHGAGLGKAAFTPVTVEAIPIPIELVTSTRVIGLDNVNPLLAQAPSIGTSLPIDFNGDGGADIVYIAQNPNQLVVRLGVPDGLGEFTINDTSPTYFLSSPNLSLDRSAGLTVGDFNEDGFPDIAVASNVEYSRDGIHVFLWNDAQGGFDLPLYSPVPFFNLGKALNYTRSGGAITNLVAGDFNGDGIMDLGFTGQYKSGTELITSLVTMSGTGDGYFFVDFAYDAINNSRDAMPVLTVAQGHGAFLLQASGIDGVTKGVQKDVLILAAKENDKSKAINILQITPSKAFSDGELKIISSATGQSQQRSWNDNTSTVEFSAPTSLPVIDFTVLDVDGNGIFDVVSLYSNGSIVAFQGASDGTIAQVDGGRGIQLTGEFGVLGAGSSTLDGSFRGILAGNFDGNAATSNIGVFSNGEGTNPRGFYTFTFDSVNPFVQSYTGKTPIDGVSALGKATFLKPSGLDTKIEAFGLYQGFIGDDTKEVGFTVGTVISNKTSTFFEVGGGDNLSGFFSVYNVDFLLEAGDGGNSQLGAGGKGGSFGSGGVTKNASGNLDDMPNASITLLIPGSLAKFSADFVFKAGQGGNGFSNGGAGGSVSGVAARYIPDTGSLASDVRLFAGDGGDSNLGTGGAGGNVQNLSVLSLVEAVAGDGGTGMRGGNGGSILGNNQPGLYDSRDASLILTAGDGGDGITAGGAGGNISNFVSGFIAIVGGSGGFLNYTAGSGGNALAGRGGNGGSVTNSGPDTTFNYLVGNISVQAGNGGNGLTGGHGGSISQFVNVPSDSTNLPHAVSFIAGNGGSGITGTGGNGGNVSQVTISSTGLSANNSLLFNRYIAGDGGTSYGSAGGNGGNVSNLNVSSTSASLVLAAGAGGDGLTRGGNGGSVTASNGSAAGAISKVLVVGGNGGDALGFLATSMSPTPSPVQQLTAFGGVASVGGNGGNISGFRQSGGVDVVTDLIAGNGGSLLNYGQPNDPRPNVGRGGSVTNIRLEGNAGTMASDQAIVSYYATTGFDNMSQFVDNWLKAGFVGTLTNAVGNVGVVAGAAGQVSVNSSPTTEGLPSNNGINGAVSSFTARNIMSMVAGSVERISAIQTLSGINLAPGGVAGAWKNTPVPHAPNTPYYFDSNGNPSSVAAPGGALMDGAVLTRLNNSGLSGIRVFTA